MVKEVVFSECSVCGETKRGNLEKFQNGLLIKGKFICWDCHNNINNLNETDICYDFYKNQIKKILY